MAKITVHPAGWTRPHRLNTWASISRSHVPPSGSNNPPRFFGGCRFASTDSTARESSRPGGRERVVILGSGWAGYGCARTLDPKKYERVVISPRSYFVFTPLLASTTVGTLEFRTILEPVRRLGLDQFHQGWADDIDFTRKIIRVEANTSDDLASKTRLKPVKRSEIQSVKGEIFDVPYDKLVIAVGSYSQTFGIDGVQEHANFLRDIGDARNIRLKVLQSFEKAALPTTSHENKKKMLHFVIVGGGPTGIEFAAELHDLIKDDLTRLYPDLVGLVGITVYDVAPKVLPMFDQTLANYAMETFKREGITIKTEHHLTRIRPDETCEGCLKLKIQEYGDEEVNAGIVVWSTGLMSNPLVKKLGSTVFRSPLNDGQIPAGSEVQLQRDPRTGGILTDAQLRVHVTPKGSSPEQAPMTASNIIPDVYAIGDCSVVSGQSLPATAQVASQKAVHLAKGLNRGDVASGQFMFRNWGVMTYLGNWKAIHQSRADDLKGRAAWVLWRTAYLTRSMTVRNKIMVPVYWAITWLFGRDISRF